MKTKDRGLINWKQATTSLQSWNVDAECSGFKERLSGLRGNPFCYLARSSYHIANRLIISAFVERWHPETSTFHLPFGEMTITLDDVKYITGLPVKGNAMNIEVNKEDNTWLANLVVECLGTPLDEVYEELTRHGGNKVSRAWLRRNIAGKCGDKARKGKGKGKAVQVGITVDQAVRGYLLFLISCTLFQDRQGDKVRIHYLYFLKDLDRIGDWAWGAGALAHLYRQMSKASRMSTVGVSGYLTLLEAWVYEHFPSQRPRISSVFKDGEMVRAMKWRPSTGVNDDEGLEDLKALRVVLDMMRRRDVIWNAYRELRNVGVDDITWFYGCIRILETVEAYHPNRVVRQFGHIQCVPRDPIPPTQAKRSERPKQYIVTHASRDDDFEGYHNHLVHESQRGVVATVDWECTPDYMSWWRSVAVRRLSVEVVRQTGELSRQNQKKIVNAIHELRQERNQRSKKDLWTVLDMAFDILTCGACSSKNPEVTEPERIQQVREQVEEEVEEPEEEQQLRRRIRKK